MARILLPWYLSAVNDVLLGALLFLPVPLVLGLFTRQPLGPWPSLALGIVLMLTHRLYARPFARSRAERRCLWCGAPLAGGPSLVVHEPSADTRWRTCDERHRAALVRTLGWAALHRGFLAIGILGTLGLFLVATSLIAAGLTSRFRVLDAVALFQLGVAATVLPFGVLAPLRGPDPAPARRLPFPVHVQALLGTLWVVWLFRLVGLWWLVAGVLQLAARLR
jgi:hypothetical protein